MVQKVVSYTSTIPVILAKQEAHCCLCNFAHLTTQLDCGIIYSTHTSTTKTGGVKASFKLLMVKVGKEFRSVFLLEFATVTTFLAM